MKHEKNLVRLKHMLLSANKAMGFLSGRKRADLDDDEMLLLAILKLIEVIGEAASKISSDLINRYTEVPWKEIISVRNRLIHGYFDINHDILWKISQDDLPPLIKILEKMILELEKS